MVRRVLAITLVGTSLVVTACGSDNDSPESPRKAAGATGSTGPTAQIPPIPVIPGGADGERGSKGSSGGGDGSSGDGGSIGKNRSKGKGGGRSPSGAPGTSPGTGGGAGAGHAPLVRSDSVAYRLSKEICANVTLEGVAVNLRINLDKRDDEFVARAYSRSFPPDHRDAAFRGCLDGFRKPVG